MSIRLLGKDVAIQYVPDASVSPGGIIIPEIAKERCKQGPVFALGPDVTENLHVGDYCIFSAYSGTIVAIENIRVIIMPEDQIQAIVVPNFIVNLDGKDYSYEELLAHLAEASADSGFNTVLGVRDGEQRKKRDRGFK